MTYLDAAYQVLKQAGQPLHYEEITRRALDQTLIQVRGLTPEATMGSRLYTDTQEDGSRFARAGKGLFALAKRGPGGIDEEVERINRATRERLRGLLTTMPPQRFEALITELLLQMGFDESTLTPYARDGGIDVKGTYRAAGLTEVNVAVQVKRWRGNVQAPTVTQLRGSLDVHQQGIIITTSDFSAGARAEAGAASKTRVGLINGEELLDLLIKHKVGVTKRALEVTALDEEWWGELLGNGAAPAQVAPPEPVEPVADATDAVVAGRAASIRPESVTLFGTVYPVRSWKGVLLTVCEALASRHPDTFAAVATSVRGRKRQYVATSGEGMISPATIGNAGLWIETNLSAASILKIVRVLLEAFGYSADDALVLRETAPVFIPISPLEAHHA